MAVISSKEFNQRASAVLKIAETEPVYITKWGKVVSVLASYAHYQAQTKSQSLAEAFSSTASTATLSEEAEQQFEQTLQQVRQQIKIRVPDLSEWE
ncbi:type II toxin-antitoxin system Phd/YefM family antitoxin [Actinobacillus arthritidis]|uniref:type II toxin-antitoxin system Phd/YefM family antitoxin n=1 Tax=Actinobacillus arthritidis TaxID=157339 RepID=UPI002442A263|nr:type II toxin-antitoxin system Phd/YefM family antitoxin [Actinobacillus arthritidis]WGE89478.1 type II toxin-antitoxin system Phd/YefM family antitoxin [Actinobacillus arthritidis]